MNRTSSEIAHSQLVNMRTQDIVLELRRRGVVRDVECKSSVPDFKKKQVGDDLPNYLMYMYRGLARDVSMRLLDEDTMLTYWLKSHEALDYKGEPLWEARVNLTVLDMARDSTL